MRTSVFGLSINECNSLHNTAGWRYEKKEYELRVLNWIAKRIYFFHQKFYQILFIFHQFNEFFHCLILHQNWLYIKRKKICHKLRQKNNVNLVFFIAITKLSLVRNVIWRTEYSMRAIYQCNVLKLLKVYNAT